MRSSLNLSSRYKNASGSQWRQKQEIDKLIKKYSKVRLSREQRQEGRNINSNNANTIQVSGGQRKDEQRNYEKGLKMKPSLRRNEGIGVGESQASNALDKGLAIAAADYVAQILAREEPECQEQREQIIKKNFLQNFANDFKIEQKDDGIPGVGKIRVIIRHHRDPEERKVLKNPKPTGSKISLSQQQKTSSNFTTQTKKRVVQTMEVKREMIQLPSVKTTTVVRVRKV